MIKELIIDVSPKNIVIALLQDKQLVELHKESLNNAFSVGDIYLGSVKKIMRGLNAAFVDIGYEKYAFLHYLDLGTQVLSLLKLTKAVRNGYPSSKVIEQFELEPGISKQGSITEVLVKDQFIPVQVSKEPISTKGPRLSSDISIPGRYLVLVPFSSVIAVSKRIKDDAERIRLKESVASIKPKNFGIIIRTASEGRELPELQKDLQYLVAKWELFITRLRTVDPSKKILGELGRTSTILRDMLDADFQNIHVNDKTIYEEVRSYVHGISPEWKKIVQLYKNKEPIFEYYGVEKQIKSAFGKTVGLARGAYLVIEHTEALHVIDVNSGNRTAKKNNQEENAIEVNKEAAKEIARQLRLRDMGGIVVVDFIDMHTPSNRKELFLYLKAEMSHDRARHAILPPSKFGLVQITRQRTRPEMNIVTAELCPSCSGTGTIRPSILLLDDIENNLQHAILEQNERNITVFINPFIEAYIKKHARQIKWLFKYKQWVKVKAMPSYPITQFHILADKQKQG